MSEPAEPTGAAQSGLGTCGQCGWRGELHACRGCLCRFCPSHLCEHELACTFALDEIVREARERVLCGAEAAMLRVTIDDEGKTSIGGGGAS